MRFRFQVLVSSVRVEAFLKNQNVQVVVSKAILVAESNADRDGFETDGKMYSTDNVLYNIQIPREW